MKLVLAALIALSFQEPTSTTQRIEVAPAESLAVHELGAGEPIVIVPGLLGSAFGFRNIAPRLAEAGYRVVIVDMLGAGSSNAPEKADYSLTAQADRVLAATRALGIDRSVFVCHAIGGSICYRIALRDPVRVAAIVSINGGPAEGISTPGLRFALKFAPIIKLFGGTGKARSKVRDGLVNSSYDPSWVTDSVVAGYTAHYSNGVGRVLGTLKRMVNAKEPAPLRPSIPEISIPVRVLMGTGSTTGVLTSEDIFGLQGIRLLSMDSVPEAGQYIHEERPDIVVSAVLETMRSTQVNAASPFWTRLVPARTATDTIR
jgi:pimeloyl-ACP methyl ester carboxylesterase